MGVNGAGENNQSPSVQILNSEPIRRFNLPDSDSERSPVPRTDLANNGAGLHLQMKMILPQTSTTNQGKLFHPQGANQAVVLFEEQQADEDCVAEASTPVAAFLKAEELELDFGNVFIGQVCGPLPIKLKASNMNDVSLSSSLYSIVFFDGGVQEIHDLSSHQFADDSGSKYAECNVFFRPDKLGP